MAKGEKRPVYEIVLVVVVVVLAVVLGIGLYAGRARMQKGSLLMRELAMLRSSIAAYKMVNHANPPSLEVLATSTYEVEAVPRPFVNNLPRGEGGKVTDPFGHPYRYDFQSGWVQSTTPGFEDL